MIRQGQASRPILRMQACMDGFELFPFNGRHSTTARRVHQHPGAEPQFDLLVTTTGNVQKRLRRQHAQGIEKRASSANIGHFDNEIDTGLTTRRQTALGRGQAAGGHTAPHRQGQLLTPSNVHDYLISCSRPVWFNLATPHTACTPNKTYIDSPPRSQGQTR